MRPLHLNIRFSSEAVPKLRKFAFSYSIFVIFRFTTNGDRKRNAPILTAFIFEHLIRFVGASEQVVKTCLCLPCVDSGQLVLQPYESLIGQQERQIWIPSLEPANQHLFNDFILFNCPPWTVKSVGLRGGSWPSL